MLPRSPRKGCNFIVNLLTPASTNVVNILQSVLALFKGKFKHGPGRGRVGNARRTGTDVFRWRDAPGICEPDRRMRWNPWKMAAR